MCSAIAKTKIEKIKAFVSKLNEASKAYYGTGRTIMDDAEFDVKLEQLKQLEEETGIILSNSPTHNVGYILTDKINKEELDHPMLSLDKVHSVDEILLFLNNREAYMSIKLDGNSVTARYENGKLVGLHSRGDGVIGNDLMIHAASFKNLPLEIPTKGTFIVDGEAIITKDDFEKINAGLPEDEKFANSRNLVAGTLSLLDSKISAERCLKFIAWNLIQDDYMTNDFLNNLAICESQGFDVVPCYRLAENYYDRNTVERKLDMLKGLAEKYQYPMDGAVITFADVAYGKSLGRTEKFFRHSIAYKYEDKTAETTLTDIEWSVGKTKITPVAHFKPVILDGTTVTKASLHNVSIFKNFKLGVGDKVTVYKSNMIIPQLRENITQSNTCTIPTTCPCCEAPTEIMCQDISEELMCTNPNCPAKILNRLKHFVSRNAINIEGISEATLQKFIELDFISSFKDIYYLKNHYNKLITIEGFGKKSIDKLLNSIEKSRETSLSRFIYSLSIPLIGRVASKQVEDYFNGNTDMPEIISELSNPNTLNGIQGFGVEMRKSISDFFNLNSMEIFELSEEFTFKKVKKSMNLSSSITGKTFVITGSVEHFKNRNELKEKIETMGGKVSGSVSKNTDYLINNDTTSNSSKNKKAKELGIKIISEEEFLELIKEAK